MENENLLPYNAYGFAIVVDGFVALENVHQFAIFEFIASFYEPEFENFEIQYWNDQEWVTVVK